MDITPTINKIKYVYKNMTEINENYVTYFQSETRVETYPTELYMPRCDIINWLQFLCDNLNFRKETLYRSISLYDLYISKAYKTNICSMYQLKLIAIACLSLSTKQEEINCNFVKFLTENVLNGKDKQNNKMEIYTVKDLVNKEIEILKQLNFKINQSTAFQFLTIFHQISFNILGNTPQFNYIVNLSEQCLLNNIKNIQSIFMLPKDISFLSCTQTLNILQNYMINKNALNCIYFQISKIFNNIFSHLKFQSNRIPLINYNYIQNL